MSLGSNDVASALNCLIPSVLLIGVSIQNSALEHDIHSHLQPQRPLHNKLKQ